MSESISSSMCAVCRDIGDMHVEKPRGFLLERQARDMIGAAGQYVYTYVHHANAAALRDSAEGGCEVCGILRDRLRSPYMYSPKFDGLVTEYTEGKGNPGDTTFDGTGKDVCTATQLAAFGKENGCYLRKDLIRKSYGNIIIYFISDEKSGPRGRRGGSMGFVSTLTTHVEFYEELYHFNTFGDALDPQLEHRPSNDLLSQPHIGLIKLWRDTCDSKHKSCCKSTEKQPLPSRILKLWDTRGEKDCVRLIETGGNMHEAYACLSYCWGDPNAQIGQTTTENLSKQLEGIPLQNLPDTVVDAIHLCYQLEIQFLWVDRLCILQDNEEDWAMEASRMCEVYSRSALTMSVPICTDSSQSFLAERRKGFREQRHFAAIPYTDEESGSKAEIWLARNTMSRKYGPWFLERSWDEFCKRDNNLENRWLGRGWTFQEWMLSPRVLHIDTMTLWDCFEGYANELNRRETGKACLIRNPNQFGKDISWDSVVREYSKREITCEKDRLPALAGLADRYAQTTGYDYLAGLWRQEMPTRLLWQRGRKSDAVNRYLPSWSWVSSDRAVSTACIRPKNFVPTASITSDYYQESGSNSFSSPEQAWIEVKGHLGAVTDHVNDLDDHKLFYVKVGDECWKSSTGHGARYLAKEIAQDKVALLVIGSMPQSSYTALIVHRCEAVDGRDLFRRLGLAWIGWGSLPRKFVSPWEEKTIRII